MKNITLLIICIFLMGTICFAGELKPKTAKEIELRELWQDYKIADIDIRLESLSMREKIRIEFDGEEQEYQYTRQKLLEKAAFAKVRRNFEAFEQKILIKYAKEDKKDLLKTAYILGYLQGQRDMFLSLGRTGMLDADLALIMIDAINYKIENIYEEYPQLKDIVIDASVVKK